LAGRKRGRSARNTLLLARKSILADLERCVKAERFVYRAAIAREHGAAMGAVHKSTSFKTNKVAPDTRRRGLQRGRQYFNRGSAMAQQEPKNFLRALVSVLRHRSNPPRNALSAASLGYGMERRYCTGRHALISRGNRVQSGLECPHIGFPQQKAREAAMQSVHLGAAIVRGAANLGT